jgi:hypothetical protein
MNDAAIITFKDIRAEHAAALAAHPNHPRPTRMKPVSGITLYGMYPTTFTKLRPILHELGIRPDKQLAEETGISRSIVMTIRRAIGIRAAVKSAFIIDPQVREDLITALRAGTPLSWAGERLHLSPKRARDVATEIGWDRTWVESSTWQSSKSERIGRLTRTKICALFKQNQTLEQIGNRAGVSRERIRQIVRDAGIEARNVTRAKARFARLLDDVERTVRKQREEPARRKRRQLEQRRHLTRFLKKARRLWDAGALIAEIADAYGVSTNSMSWHLHAGRVHLGWFPHRQPRTVKRGATLTRLRRQPSNKRSASARRRSLPA